MMNIDNWTKHVVKKGVCQTCQRKFHKDGTIIAKRDGSIWEGQQQLLRVDVCGGSQ
jgi:hypothetical protein